jgi:hypothetical protein
VVEVWFECAECSAEVHADRRPRYCHDCGAEDSMRRRDGSDDREKGEDDGVEYSDPRGDE